MDSNAVVNHIVNWLKSYAQNAGVNGFVVGISGGIDSAVTSALCAKTGLVVVCVEMPIHQDSLQVSRGQKHIAELEKSYPNVSSQCIDLTASYDLLSKTLPTTENQTDRDLGLANTRARLRMTTLYFIAGVRKLLVAGTGNKIEDFGVGFYTKYGDGGVDLSPIADLTKSEVYEIGATQGIEEEIMKAPPTDGLWGDSRTDEDQIGASYPDLEWAMQFSGDESKLNAHQKNVLNIYRTLHRQNKHKMISIPVCEIPESIR